MTASAQSPRFANVGPAHVIRSDAEAIAIAHKIAARFVDEASVRDRERGPYSHLARSGHVGNIT
jgi:hypothetical protein